MDWANCYVVYVVYKFWPHFFLVYLKYLRVDSMMKPKQISHTFGSPLLISCVHIIT